MKQSGFLRPTHALTTGCLVAYSLGLGLSASGSPEIWQISGYHMEVAKPSAWVTPDPPAETPDLEARLLNESLSSLRSGDLEHAVTALRRLTRLAPADPRYPRLLYSAERLVNSQSWYRYQKRFELGWAASQ